MPSTAVAFGLDSTTSTHLTHTQRNGGKGFNSPSSPAWGHSEKGVRDVRANLTTDSKN